ncbi:GTP-binding protein [Paracoccus sp. PS-1]|uniref:CobW family GTP-binding protein n=1 Tax=unclassified Paracoccus (in: a-proteobacteria) TaxID=2688777 RepID=UPI0004B1C09A|nr:MULTISPECIES: GTP-binding protein [unclassified Paracoccus (in: a-proteobacteria)]MDQ7261270.1 GTP-binding protein [Paracoccus sp. PS1]
MTDPSPTPLPVTLLTGFLGSGKTTVLNGLLRHRDFGRTAIIINEFGEIGLDHELVVSTTETLVLLQSGCMCCALRGDLLDTLVELAERREAGELDFERVMIETTGLADPAPILHTLLTSMDLSERFVTDGVVATVDAATGPDTLRRHEEARRQVALADLVLLTKTDLPEADEPAARREIAALNSAAPVQIALQGRIDPRRLTGLGHFDPTMKSAEAQGWLRQEAVPVPKLADLDALRHLDAIRSVSWVIDEPISATAFDLWMEMLMAQRGADLLRFKGLIHLQGVPHPFVVHGVQHIFHPPVLLTDWQGEDRRSKLVLILRDFTDPELRDLFSALNSVAVSEHVLPVGYLSAEVTP